jgi:hypothetical protein
MLLLPLNMHLVALARWTRLASTAEESRNTYTLSVVLVNSEQSNLAVCVSSMTN